MAPGQSYDEYLMGQGLNMEGIVQYPDTNTGSAFICVDARGENFIVTLAGANQMLTAQDVLSANAVIENADVLLCQLETPVEAVVCALQHAASLGKVTILNPSPLSAEFPWGQVQIDFLIVNEREAGSLLGYFVESTAEAPQIRTQMADMGVNTLIITRGAEPYVSPSTPTRRSRSRRLRWKWWTRSALAMPSRAPSPCIGRRRAICCRACAWRTSQAR